MLSSATWTHALTRMVQPILDGGHPLLVFSLPASGHDWMYAHRCQRQGHRVTLLHRVVFHGDHLDSSGHLARLMGMKLVEEG